MAYRSIFAALTEFESARQLLDYAVALTEAQDGHLEVMALGIDRTPATYYEIGSNAIIMQAAIEQAHQRAESAHKDVRAFLDKSNVRWDVLNGIASAAGVGRTISAHSRFCDLAIAGLAYGAASKIGDGLVPEGLLFEADCPVIVVPGDVTYATPTNITIAWNQSAEALRAVKGALPLLKAAQLVRIAIIDPSESWPERSDPGGALAVYLSRHGIKPDIQVMTRQGLKVSERLNHHATETGADLLVMGGYGHSRFREAVLGGATREMLEHASIPVLMAH